MEVFNETTLEKWTIKGSLGKWGAYWDQNDEMKPANKNQKETEKTKQNK